MMIIRSSHHALPSTILLRSPLWDSVSAEERRKFKFHKSDDGEFWMSYDDFFNNFDVLQLCHCRPDSLSSWAEGISTSEPSSVSETKKNSYVIPL